MLGSGKIPPPTFDKDLRKSGCKKGICSKNPRFCCVAEANCCRCLFYLRVMGRAMDSSTRLGGYKKALCTAFVQQSLKEVL